MNGRNPLLEGYYTPQQYAESIDVPGSDQESPTMYANPRSARNVSAGVAALHGLGAAGWMTFPQPWGTIAALPQAGYAIGAGRDAYRAQQQLEGEHPAQVRQKEILAEIHRLQAMLEQTR